MKPSAYLETSVVGAYLDNGEPFRRDLTIRWWEHELSEYRAVISPLVTRELERLDENWPCVGIQRLLHRPVRNDVTGDEHDVGGNFWLVRFKPLEQLEAALRTEPDVDECSIDL